MIEAQGRQHIGKNAHPKASPLADRCPRDSGSEAVAPVKFPVLCWPGLTTTTWFATWRFIEGIIEISNQQHGRRRVHRLSDTPREGAAARERCVLGRECPVEDASGEEHRVAARSRRTLRLNELDRLHRDSELSEI